MPDQPRGLRTLTDSERELVRQCLEAAAYGPFFADGEFHTLFGLEREEVVAVLSRWPDIDDSDEVARLAVNNSMNNLVGYPHRCEREWPEFIAEPRTEVLRVLRKWRADVFPATSKP